MPAGKTLPANHKRVYRLYREEGLIVRPGKPVQNAHIESFHGRFRDECLNESWFLTLAAARRIIEAWRQDYNTVRPHSALGYLTPEAFEQRNPNGECGKQRAEPEGGA